MPVPPFLKQPPYFTNPSLFGGKSEPPFGKDFENSNPPFVNQGGGGGGGVLQLWRHKVWCKFEGVYEQFSLTFHL